MFPPSNKISTNETQIYLLLQKYRPHTILIGNNAVPKVSRKASAWCFYYLE